MPVIDGPPEGPEVHYFDAAMREKILGLIPEEDAPEPVVEKAAKKPRKAAKK